MCRYGVRAPGAYQSGAAPSWAEFLQGIASTPVIYLYLDPLLWRGGGGSWSSGTASLGDLGLALSEP